MRQLAQELSYYVRPVIWGGKRDMPDGINAYTQMMSIEVSANWGLGHIQLHLPDGYYLTLAIGSNAQQAFERLRLLIAHKVVTGAKCSDQ